LDDDYREANRIGLDDWLLWMERLHVSQRNHASQGASAGGNHAACRLLTDKADCEFMGKKKKKTSAKRYAVGYGRPPLSTRFRAGESGNAQGRPKGLRGTRSMAQATLEQKILVSRTGVPKRMSVREIAFQRLAEKGDGW
jgi:hypothetical protein